MRPWHYTGSLSNTEDADEDEVALATHDDRFLTAEDKQYFMVMDPYKKGTIDDKSLVGDLLQHVAKDASEEHGDEIWGLLDDDGNGYASFAEFFQWVQKTDFQPLAALATLEVNATLAEADLDRAGGRAHHGAQHYGGGADG